MLSGLNFALPSFSFFLFFFSPLFLIELELELEEVGGASILFFSLIFYFIFLSVDEAS